MSELRLVTDNLGDPMAYDQAVEAINERWIAARTAYADTISTIGHVSLRALIEPTRRPLGRYDMAVIRDRARDLARHATRMADELDRAVSVYERATP